MKFKFLEVSLFLLVSVVYSQCKPLIQKVHEDESPIKKFVQSNFISEKDSGPFHVDTGKNKVSSQTRETKVENIPSKIMQSVTMDISNENGEGKITEQASLDITTTNEDRRNIVMQPDKHNVLSYPNDVESDISDVQMEAYDVQVDTDDVQSDTNDVQPNPNDKKQLREIQNGKENSHYLLERGSSESLMDTGDVFDFMSIEPEELTFFPAPKMSNLYEALETHGFRGEDIASLGDFNMVKLDQNAIADNTDLTSKLEESLDENKWIVY